MKKKIPLLLHSKFRIMKIVLSLVAALLFLSCSNSDSNSYKINGNALGFADGTQVFIYELDANSQPVVNDTLVVTNGLFSASYPKTEDTKVKFFKVDGTKNSIIFFAENENITANIYKDSIGSSNVLGGKQNELYREYNMAMRAMAVQKNELGRAYQKAQSEQDGVLVTQLRQQSQLLTAKEQNYKRQFVSDNNNSMFSLMLLTEMLGRDEISGPEASEVLGKLSPKMTSSPLVTSLKKTISAKKKADIGGMAPEFSARTPEGTVMSLNDALGKYTIIDFWASWCRPCRVENPNVVRVYEKYHDKGLNIISVSLDRANQKERWIKAIADDNMNWYHVSNLKFWQDPIARQYNVRSIPSTFLLDESGKIIDKNLRGAALEAKIASLLD